LISRNRAIGTLVLARLRDDAFSQADISFLPRSQADALAVENALAYREIRELKESSRRKTLLEDEIRTEMNLPRS